MGRIIISSRDTQQRNDFLRLDSMDDGAAVLISEINSPPRTRVRISLIMRCLSPRYARADNDVSPPRYALHASLRALTLRTFAKTRQKKIGGKRRASESADLSRGV